MRRLFLILLLLMAACPLSLARGARDRAPKSESATGAPEATVSPGSLDFGDQVIGAISKAQRITVTASGNDKLYINSTTLAGDDWQQFRVTADTCTGATLAPQKSCIIDVVCIPAKRGSLKTVLTIKDNGIDSSQRVTVSGNGINSVDVPPSESDF